MKRQSHCNPLQHTANTATAGSAWSAVAVCCSGEKTRSLQHSATHSNTLQHTATCYNCRVCLRCSILLQHSKTLQHTATHCNTLQQTHCNSLQQNAGSADGAVYYGTLGGRDAEYECCHGTLCCSVLQGVTCIAMCCSMLQYTMAPEGKRR